MPGNAPSSGRRLGPNRSSGTAALTPADALAVLVTAAREVLDRTAARAFGFPDIVVQGMVPICFVSELLTRDFRGGWLTGGKMDIRLVNVLWANETVSAHADVREEVPEADRTRVHMDVWVEKADGTKVIVGQASALRS